jgi:hypothetical protein
MAAVLFNNFTFAADSRVFVNVHALHNGRFFHAHFLADFFDFVVEGYFLECRVQPVQSVTNLYGFEIFIYWCSCCTVIIYLIQSSTPVHFKLSIVTDGTCFQKVPDFVTTFQKVFVFVLRNSKF